MKRSILVLVCASATLLVAARTASREYARKSAGSSQSERKSAPAPNLARMEQVVQSFVKDKQFMGAVLVARENEVLRSEEHTSELQSRLHLVCRLLLEKKKKTIIHICVSSILTRYYSII